MFALAREFVLRAVNANPAGIAPSPAEEERLAAAGVTDPLARRYAVWRRAVLWVSVVPTAFAAVFGLNYISTVPPTTTLTANIFGRYSVGTLSGWIFFSHQVGSALGAAAGGWIFDFTGSYSWAFISAAIMAFVASGLSLVIKEENVSKTPTPSPAAAGVPVPAA